MSANTTISSVVVRQLPSVAVCKYHRHRCRLDKRGSARQGTESFIRQPGRSADRSSFIGILSPHTPPFSAPLRSGCGHTLWDGQMDPRRTHWQFPFAEQGHHQRGVPRNGGVLIGREAENGLGIPTRTASEAVNGTGLDWILGHCLMRGILLTAWEPDILSTVMEGQHLSLPRYCNTQTSCVWVRRRCDIACLLSSNILFDISTRGYRKPIFLAISTVSGSSFRFIIEHLYLALQSI